MQRLTGLIAAPVTPFHDDGSIAPEVVPAYAERLVQDGVAGVFVNGTTGESLSLAKDERLAMAEAWVAAASGTPLRVVVHAGCESLADARELAAHAQRIGAAAVGAMPPVFFRAAGPDALADAMAEVAGGCPDLPFYYYHMPSMTVQEAPMRLFLPKLRERAANTAGAKFTFENVMDYALALDAGFDVLFGRDEMLLSALVMGARGAVGSTYNVMAPLYNRLVAAFDAGDLDAARSLQLESMRAIDRMAGARGVPMILLLKQLLTRRGVPCGPVRRPMPLPSPDAVAAAVASLPPLLLSPEP
ncbi:MAG: dihydrodipicolinate synthase family protein [Kiritimatiellia bacterium]|jgi:N-acetylneuraminate lyase